MLLTIHFSQELLLEIFILSRVFGWKWKGVGSKKQWGGDTLSGNWNRLSGILCSQARDSRTVSGVSPHGWVYVRLDCVALGCAQLC